MMLRDFAFADILRDALMLTRALARAMPSATPHPPNAAGTTPAGIRQNAAHAPPTPSSLLAQNAREAV